MCGLSRTLISSILAAVSVAALPIATAETLDEALALAHENNPQLQAQYQSLEIARERVSEARSGRMPEVSIGANYGYQSTETNRPVLLPPGTTLVTEQPFYTAEVEAQLPLYTGGQVSAGIRQAKAERSAAELQYDAAAQALTLNVVTAYLDVLTARETIRIRENSVELLSQQVVATRDRFEIGVVTRTDVALSEARLEAGRAALASAQAGLEAANAAYMFLTGTLPGELVETGPAPSVPATFDEALNIALANNPGLQAQIHADRSASEAVKVAAGSLRPTVALVGTAGVQETLTDEYEDTNLTAMLSASVPLFERGVRKSQLRQSRHVRQQARLDLDNVRRAVRADVATSWFGRLAAQSAITASERRVAAAEIAYEGAREELSVGNRTTLDVLDQEQALLDARLGLVEAERDAFIATFQLHTAMGSLTGYPHGAETVQ